MTDPDFPGTATDPRPGRAPTAVYPDTPLRDGPLDPGEVLQDRYRILRVCGRGGHSTVYEAEHLGLGGRRVAIKEMRSRDDTDDDAPQRRFAEEARVLARLQHPRLPAVTDCFSTGGRHYLVMEFIEGETLDARVRQEGKPIPEPIVLQWAGELCDVLEYIHSQDPPVIFRDLTLPNIMVDSGEHVKLIDFGIVRTFKPGQLHDTQSMGTNGYCAPEQYGSGQTDARSDLYALGACLHHLLSARHPWKDPFRFPPLRELNPAVSVRTEQVVARCLASSPEDRYASAPEVKKALLDEPAEPATSDLPPGAIASRLRALLSGGPANPKAARANGSSSPALPVPFRRGALVRLRDLPPTTIVLLLLVIAVVAAALSFALAG